MEIKPLMQIYAPVILGEPTYIKFSNGNYGTTTPQRIDSINCTERGLIVVMTTQNSCYKGVIPYIKKPEEYCVGQEIKKGSIIKMKDGSSEIVDSIVEIKRDGIVAKLGKGIGFGKIKLQGIN